MPGSAIGRPGIETRKKTGEGDPTALCDEASVITNYFRICPWATDRPPRVFGDAGQMKPVRSQMQTPGGHVRRRGKAKIMGEGDPTALCDEVEEGGRHGCSHTVPVIIPGSRSGAGVNQTRAGVY